MQSELKGIRVGQRLDAYHDGKASPSRLVKIVVDEILSRDDMTKSERRLWRDALRRDFNEAFDGIVYYAMDDGTETRQFWDWNCDEFVVGHILYDQRTIRDRMLFARRSGGLKGYGWYGVNWNYWLDLKGKVRKRDSRTWKANAKANGKRMEWNAESGRYDYFDAKTGKKAED